MEQVQPKGRKSHLSCVSKRLAPAARHWRRLSLPGLAFLNVPQEQVDLALNRSRPSEMERKEQHELACDCATLAISETRASIPRARAAAALCRHDAVDAPWHGSIALALMQVRCALPACYALPTGSAATHGMRLGSSQQELLLSIFCRYPPPVQCRYSPQSVVRAITLRGSVVFSSRWVSADKNEPERTAHGMPVARH